MKRFGSYVLSLERLYLTAARHGADEDLRRQVDQAIDGQAGRELRKLVPLADLRATGTFFTGSELANQVAARIIPSLGPNARILDPACGAGDLLIACAKRLPAAGGFRATLAAWGRSLAGRDLQPEFVAAARYRLALAALARGLLPRRGGNSNDKDRFGNVIPGCGLQDANAISQATHVVLNPPFNMVAAPPDCEWTSGGVSAAAVFLDRFLRSASPGTRVVAILPDVLRSGARYRRWRQRITSSAKVISVALFGQFDRWADVDVFLLELVASRSPASPIDPWQLPLQQECETVGELFDVSVGPVVPFRHRSGQWRRYLHARGLPAWGVMEETRERRRFDGTLHEPPFVVVRRTSRLGDRHRAVATVVAGTEPVAVENHLLVLRPKRGGLAECHRLLKSLQLRKTDDWLNHRIRCRHLTVGAVRQLPVFREAV
jgi:hypothetical protein